MTNAKDNEPLDLELWVEYCQGDRSAFTALYRRHAAAVIRYAWSIVHDRVAAEEVLQDTFLTAWDKRRASHIVDESFLPWLLVVCRNHARNAVRKAAKHGAVSIERVTVRVSDPPDELAWIAVEIDRLSASDQLLCRLCLMEGYSYAEAARILDTTQAAVGKRLQRVRARLAQATGASD
jgi:RNA polymerase sigma factor (sigma-70 family)